MKAYVNDACIGCSLCAGSCPEVFTMNEDGRAVASGEVPAGLEADARAAAEACPVNAIELS